MFYRVFSSKYFPNGLVLDAKPSSGSYAWQSIVKAIPLIKLGMLWRVGDGKQIKFFGERWLPGDEPAKVISPSNSATVKWTVSMMMDPSGAGWNEHLVDAMFLPFEAQRIKGIPLCITSQADCVLWPKCKTGSYSVRSSYQLLCQAEAIGAPSRSSDEGVKRFWKNIWRLKVPNKVKVFLWRACSSALPTKVGLHKRKIVNDNLCEQCWVEAEDEVHAVWNCDCIHAVWEVPFAVARTKNPRMNSMSDLVSFIADEIRELDKFAMKAWVVWQRRNKLQLKEENTPIHKVYNFAMSLLTEFQQKKKRPTSQRQSKQNRWLPPPPNSVKINFNGAVFSELKEAGVGVVV